MHLLVVGGNGFLGSAICKSALTRGWKVSSISSSGVPYKTPKGHVPSWTSNVQWHRASAFHPDSYKSLLPSVSAIVHTIGILLENTSYKAALRKNNPFTLLSSPFMPSSINPLSSEDNTDISTRGTEEKSYESLNKDSALIVLSTFLESITTAPSSSNPRTFVYISAEDVGRPFVPARYIKSKREAEKQISNLCSQHDPPLRELLIRPNLMYHAHLRPLVSPMAAMIDLSATLHDRISPHIPTPARILRALGPFTSSLSSEYDVPPVTHSLATLLETHPLHVDQVARATCEAISSQVIRGVVDTNQMRSLVGTV